MIEKIITCLIVIILMLNPTVIDDSKKTIEKNNNIRIVVGIPVTFDMEELAEGAIYYIEDEQLRINYNPLLNIIGEEETIYNTDYEGYYKNRIKELEENIPEGFYNNLYDWKFIITNKTLERFRTEDLTDEQFVAGATLYKERNIYILISNDCNRSFDDIVYHELGHALDCNLNVISNTEEFTTIFNKEKTHTTNAFTNHTLSDSTEFFAEGFCQYMKNSTEMQIQMPKTYNYFKCLEERLRNNEG